MNHEEKILEMLTGITETVNKQGEMLTRLTEAVNKQGEMIEQINGRLDRLETAQAQQADMLSELREKVDELDDRSRRSAVLLETEIAPKVQLLFEGQKNLLDTLASKERVEKLEKIVEERVVVLESVVRSHAERITALEKSR